MEGTTIHVFTTSSLRLHDNPSFCQALEFNNVRPIFVYDPFFEKAVSKNVLNFLFDCLTDLDTRLKRYNLRLHVFVGNLLELLPVLITDWRATNVTFQPSGTRLETQQFEAYMENICDQHDVKVWKFTGHTLYEPDVFIKACEGRLPGNYSEFQQIVQFLGKPTSPIPEPLPKNIFDSEAKDEPHPREVELSTFENNDKRLWDGGETQALSKLFGFCQQRIASYETQDINNILTGRDSLSPYLRFGCLSVRLFYSRLYEYASSSNRGFQLYEVLFKSLLLREFAYHVGSNTPGFDGIEGNPFCLNIPWENDPKYLSAFREGVTGFPWIDAIVTQIRSEGWAHHLARRSLAVFITRGCLWLSWMTGRDFFQENMLDFEFPVSTVCWMQDSCSGFFHWKADVLDPCVVGKQMDPDGSYVKRYIPALNNMPSEYVHSPWKAPRSVQEKAGCIVGEHYPNPICNLCSQSMLCCKRLQFIRDKLQELFS